MCKGNGMGNAKDSIGTGAHHGIGVVLKYYEFAKTDLAVCKIRNGIVPNGSLKLEFRTRKSTRIGDSVGPTLIARLIFWPMC